MPRIPHYIKSVSSNSNSGFVGCRRTITVNYVAGKPDTLVIDPDGEGSLPPQNIPVNIGDTTSSINAFFNTAGSFTPEAWYDSDKIKVQGNPITI